MATARLMTWNIRGAANPDLGALAAEVRGYLPDVLALQEVKRGQARRLGRRLGWHDRWVPKHYPYGPFLWWRAEGLAVLSPHHLEAKKRYILSPGMRPWTYRRRVALRVKVGLPELTIRLFDVHLASHGSAKQRAAQAQLLAGIIAEERMRAEDEPEPFRVVVIGDLNAHDEHATLDPLVAAGFRDCWVVAETPPEGDGFTAPISNLRNRIDYVLIEERDACETVEVPSLRGHWGQLSDHFPVVATVRFAE